MKTTTYNVIYGFLHCMDTGFFFTFAVIKIEQLCYFWNALLSFLIKNFTTGFE